jgi:enoyl-CoA hydratase/carnithine racemase
MNSAKRKTYRRVVIEKDSIDGRILWIKLNYPERLNVLHVELMEEVYDALVNADKDDTVQAVIITSIGKAFCAGADVKELMSIDLEGGLRWLQAYWRVFDLLRETGKPVIAAVKGYCVAGGNEWVLACDLVVAGKSAVFGQPEPIIGSTAFLAVLLLPIVVGERRAREMLLTGKLISADEAYRIGLVNKVVPDEEVEEEARKLAIEIIDRVNPQAFRIVKSGLRFWTDLPLLLIRFGRDLTVWAWLSDMFRERCKAFLEKRPMKPGKFMGITPKEPGQREEEPLTGSQ